jgi:hypothetical protein
MMYPRRSRASVCASATPAPAGVAETRESRSRFIPLGCLCLLLAGALLNASLPALAQSDRGTITGTVTDPQGAVVPNASVALRGVATGVEYSTVSTGTGNYTVPALPVGRYNLTVAAPGFNQYIQEGIEVRIAVTARVDVVLKIGATSESVTVQADAPLLRTESADQSQTVGGDTINQLPLTLGGNNLYGTRNPLAALDLTPGASNTVGTNFIFRVNGSTNQARYLLDGQDISLLGMTAAHLSESHPSTEAVQEVTLMTSNFAAEYGQVQGGLVSFTSRSGTNQLHGGAYDYIMNEALNAGRPFTDDGNGHLIRPRQRNQNWGFTVGGPVWLPKLYDGRNRTFFFFTLDQFRQGINVGGSALTVPTDAYRKGDFSAALTGRTLGTDVLGRVIKENTIYDPSTQRAVNGQVVRDPFTGNVIPTAQLDPVALNIQSYIPLAATTDVVNNLPVVDHTWTITTLPSVKIDHLVGVKTKISFYFGTWSNFTQKYVGDGLPWPISTAREFVTHTPSFRFTVDQTVTPTFLVHLAVGEVRYWHTDANPAISRDFDGVGKLGYVGALGGKGFPRVSGLNSSFGGLASANSSGALGWGSATLPHVNDHPTAVLSGTLIRGNHSYKIGAEWWKDQDGTRGGATAGTFTASAAQTGLPYLQTTTVGGGGIGFPYASFLLGAMNTGSIQNRSEPLNLKFGLGIYAQDTWKITRRLTLDYGLRWDRQTASHELNYRNSTFARFTPNPSAGGLPGATAYANASRESFAETYNFGFGPRLGLAYQIDSKTVLRAGWGFVYGRTARTGGTSTFGVGFNTLNFTNSNYGDAALFLRNGLSYDINKLYAATYDPGIRPSPGQIDAPPNWYDDTGGRPPRINQWNISLQREFFRDLLVEGAYVGNRSSHIEANNALQLNALSPQMYLQKGFDVTNAADRTVLLGLWTSAAAQARGIKAPYAGYPTGLTVAQLLRPYPQFSSVGNAWTMRGFSWYDALQAKVTKRTSRGLTAIGSFSWQKELEYGTGVVNNVFNEPVNKQISGSSQPFVFTMGITYQTPAVGPNRWVRSVVRDWTVGAMLRNASGYPIMSPAAQNNLQLLMFGNSSASTSGSSSMSLASGTFANRVAGQPLFLKDLNCHCIDPNQQLVLNPAAWSDPAPGQFGTAAAYYSDYRFQRHPAEQLGIGRLFQIREGMSVEVRFEFFNVLNRLQMADPTASNALATAKRNAQGVLTAGFGWINSQSVGNQQGGDNPTGLGGNPRQGQFLARLRF